MEYEGCVEEQVRRQGAWLRETACESWIDLIVIRNGSGQRGEWRRYIRARWAEPVRDGKRSGQSEASAAGTMITAYGGKARELGRYSSPLRSDGVTSSGT